MRVDRTPTALSPIMMGNLCQQELVEESGDC